MSRSRNKPIGIRQLAKQLSLSVGTVSRALNDQPGVREKTRQQVLLAAKKSGYLPNVQARSFRTRRSQQIGIVLPSLDDPTYVEKIRSAHDAAWERGYDVAFAATEWDPKREITAGQHLLSRGVDGLIALSHYTFLEHSRQAILDRGVKTLLISSLPPTPEIVKDANVIEVDAPRGVARSIEYLLELGHERIGLLGFSRATHNNSHKARIEAMQAVACERGLDPDHFTLIETADDTFAAAYASLTEWLKRNAPLPTALQAINDYAALGAIRALADAQLRVPEDISVVGYGGVELTTLSIPRLTTVSQMHLDLGSRAVRTIINAIEQPDAEPTHTRLDTELVIRESTAPPADRR